MSELQASCFNNTVDSLSLKFFGALSSNQWYATPFDDSDKPIDNRGVLCNDRAGSAGGIGLKYDEPSTGGSSTASFMIVIGTAGVSA